MKNRWRRVRSGYHVLEQIWGSKPDQRRVIAEADQGASGWWFVMVDDDIFKAVQLNHAKTLAEECVVPKSRSIETLNSSEERGFRRRQSLQRGVMRKARAIVVLLEGME